MLKLPIPPPPVKINWQEGIVLIGSCFTEHIGNQLLQLKLPVTSNPTGILFDPPSIARHLEMWKENQPIRESDLFIHEEIWKHPQFHSQFAYPDKSKTLNALQTSIHKGHQALQQAKHVCITLGTAFSYYHIPSENRVANCHKLPATQYQKTLLSVAEIEAALESCISSIPAGTQIIFTISPVRHIRDGIIENNRSKGRLIDAVHTICVKHTQCVYFPAYELLMDVLRDYRFYHQDWVHPNFLATEFIIREFFQAYLSDSIQEAEKEIRVIQTGLNHRVMHPETSLHQAFLNNLEERISVFETRFPYLDWSKEKAWLKTTRESIRPEC